MPEPGSRRRRDAAIADLIERADARALPCLEALCRSWRPSGWREGGHYVAAHPFRDDEPPDALRIDLATGTWQDLVSGDCGMGAVSFFAHLTGTSLFGAALRLREEAA